MPKKYVHTEIDGQKIKLTNLDKIIYPSIGLVKAEVIQYFIEMSEWILKYTRNRPLTLLRFPDGVDGKRFYMKDKPSWTPEWVNSIRLTNADDVNNYVVAKDQATLAWLGNLAALEVHPMQSTIADLDRPDHWIIDLDPDEGLAFDRVKEVALQLNEFLQQYGYRPLIKTSGSKGLHLVMPLPLKWTYDVISISIKSLMKRFIKQINSDCTLHVHKHKRKGKILLDIYRNHRGNTIVAPYSLRGKTGAPISTPISWEKVELLSSAQEYHIGNISDHLNQYGDAWEYWDDHISPLHDQVVAIGVDTRSSESKLKQYVEKRDFRKTSEPRGVLSSGPNDRFVVQLHNSTNLHYDLRLEVNGVLKSWAIPKGLPVRLGIKRLAIQTEDHPVKYLSYEGVIPKGEYGAGEMWIYAQGKYTWMSQAKNKLEFVLTGSKYNRRYKMYKTKNEQWLIECLENSDENLLDQKVLPMLASTASKLPAVKNKIYEIKWDGIRAVIYLEDGRVKIWSRNGNDLTDKFPELTRAVADFDVYSGIFDSEIVCLDDEGKPIFNQVISRMHTVGEQKILKATKTNPVNCYLFDVMALDGKDTMSEPLVRRQEWLNTALCRQGGFRISQTMEDGPALAGAAQKAGLEGVMVKDSTSIYRPGQRTNDWLKVKFRQDDECTIIGYTAGQGDRSGSFGALHLAKLEGEKWVYYGKVGSGFNSDLLKSILKQMKDLKAIRKYIDDKIEEEHRTIWIEPRLRCKIKFASMTEGNSYREPVFMSLI